MGIWRWMAVVALLPAAAALGEATSSAPDVDTLLQHLTRPAPATTPFVEIHFSPLLSRPLIVSGEMEYDGPDALDVGVPAPLGPPVGVADAHAERRMLAAHLTYRCHRLAHLSRSSTRAVTSGSRGRS